MKWYLLACILSVTGYGAVVENLNPLKETLYYSVDHSKVSLKKCDVPPASDLDPSQCHALSADIFDYGPIDLKEFQERAKQWAQTELSKIASSLADARTELARSRKQLAEIDELIKGLPAGSPALSDYQDRRKEISQRISKLEEIISLDEGQSADFNLLFGQSGYLQQDLIHPIVDGQSTYLSVRPFVRHFFEIFKYRSSDPIKPLADAKADFARLQSEGRRPYCAYWNGGFGGRSELDSSKEAIIRTLISLDRSESFQAARASCQALGMDLPSAQHIPGYHSHLWTGEEETWPIEKSTRMFAQTELAKRLPNFDYLGGQLKIFWVQMTWYSRYHKPGDMDAYFTSADGSWFRFNDGQDEGGVGVKATALPVDPSWSLSVVCEKQYPDLPRYIESGELKECVEYVGWP